MCTQVTSTAWASITDTSLWRPRFGLTGTGRTRNGCKRRKSTPRSLHRRAIVAALDDWLRFMIDGQRNRLNRVRDDSNADVPGGLIVARGGGPCRRTLAGIASLTLITLQGSHTPRGLPAWASNVPARSLSPQSESLRDRRRFGKLPPRDEHKLSSVVPLPQCYGWDASAGVPLARVFTDYSPGVRRT